MGRKIDVEPPASVMRKQPLLTTKMTSSTPTNLQAYANSAGTGGGPRRRKSKVGEATGDCAAVCCCCPCAAVHLLLLAVYRFPAGLWRKKKRKMLLRKKRKLLSKEKENQRKANSFGLPGGEEAECSTDDEDCSGKNDAVDWDNEMWDQFHGAGFWRSDSRKKEDE